MAATTGSARPSPPRFRTIAEAAQEQDTEVVLEMVSSGYDINGQDADGNTALHWAAWFRLEALVPQLVEHGASSDAQNVSGETPVHWAAAASNIHALEAITASNSGLFSKRDCDGCTPFLILAQNDNPPVMEWMYLRGISIEEQDNFGRTALQWACYLGHRKAVQWLLSRGANIFHRDQDGMTAIHWAALKGYEQVSDMLIDAGAARLLACPDASGDTPVALAMRKRHRAMVLGFMKCQLFRFLLGRPTISRNHLANLFMAFVALNILVYITIILPAIAGQSPGPSCVWCMLISAAVYLWFRTLRSDPGWMGDRAVRQQGQEGVPLDDQAGAFDPDQPVESQLAGVDERRGYEQSSWLARIELDQTRMGYQRQLLNKARQCLHDEGFRGGGLLEERSARGVELVPLMDVPQPHEEHHMQLDRVSSSLEERAAQTSEAVGRRRVQELLDLGRREYVNLLNEGNYKRICVVCRVQREMRSHHCKECGRCVRRLDHHCPWVDNCIGLHNQRSFFIFIVVLLVTIIYFHFVSILYMTDAIVPAWASGEAEETLMSFRQWISGPGGLRPIIVLLTCVVDLPWLLFVGALVARHMLYMAVNITTFEVLVRPPHVQRRFHRCTGRFWFLHGLALVSSLRNCRNYWTVNLEEELVAFKRADDHQAAASGEHDSDGNPAKPPGARGTVRAGSMDSA